MKKILTSLALLGVVAGGAYAQNTAIVSAYVETPDSIALSNCSSNDSFLVTYGFVNMGPYTIQPTDTFAFGDFEAANSGGGWISYSDVAIAPGDTFNVQSWYSNKDRVHWLIDRSTGDEVDSPIANGSYIAVAQFFGFYTQTASGWAPRTDITYDDTTDQIYPYDVFALDLDCPTGISDINYKKTALNIYPNPANANVNVKYNFTKSTEAGIRVVDVTGRTVINNNLGKQAAGEKVFTVDVSSLAPGMYTVELVTDDVRAISKLTVTK